MDTTIREEIENLRDKIECLQRLVNVDKVVGMDDNVDIDHREYCDRIYYTDRTTGNRMVMSY